MMKLPSSIHPDLYYEIQKTVSFDDVASNYGSHELENLLATPTYVAMSIEAAVRAVDHLLPQGFVTVGHSFEIVHDAPTTLGMTITVKTTLSKVENTKLYFMIEACDEAGKIGHGTHVRFIVNKEILLQKANERAGSYIKK